MDFLPTFRYFWKKMLADSIDFDINYMAALISPKSLNLSKNTYFRTASQELVRENSAIPR